MNEGLKTNEQSKENQKCEHMARVEDVMCQGVENYAKM